MSNSIYMTEQQERKYRGFLWLLLLAGIAALLFSIYFSYWNKIPSQIRIRAGVEQEFDFRVPVSGEIYRMPEEAAPVASVTDVDEKDEAFLLAGEENSADSIHVDFARTVKLKANQIDSYQMNLKLFGVLPYKNVDIEVIQDKMLIPSGIPIGIYVKTDGVLVVGIGEFESSGGETISPAKYVLQKGDYILESNGEPVENKKQFIRMVEDSQGEDMVLTIRRNNEITDICINAGKNRMEEWKLGIWIRDNAQGIGTMTYEGTDSTFGALGHGINDVDTSILMNLEEGTLYRTEIVGITRGANGAPGELTGYIEYDSDNVIGEITENTAEGIFGVCDEELVTNSVYEPVPIALKQEIEIGPAQIICSVSGEPEFYDLCRHYCDLLHQKLLMLTGGIIQGMSGSPIIQNGKLVGAVTHVLVNDSTKGYGIFIEEMLTH